MSEKQLQTPIALVAHDRPQHLKATLEALSLNWEFEKCPLFIFCDAPRSPAHEERCAQVRSVAKQWATKWSGVVVERDFNMGFGNLISAVSQLCSEWGSAIVVEDDIIPAPDFISYMRACLKRYAKEERVFSVNGFMFYDDNPLPTPTFFLSTAFATGWATWRRAWEHFEWRPQGVEAFLAHRERRKSFDFNGKWRMSDWLEKAMKGNLACWDPQWAFKIFDSDAVGLFPNRSLIWNTGMGCGMGVSEEALPNFDQCHDQTFYGNLTRADFNKPRLLSPSSELLSSSSIFPERVEVDPQAYQRMVTLFRRERARQRLASVGPWWKRYPQSLLKKIG
jgi:hypothetical protein